MLSDCMYTVQIDSFIKYFVHFKQAVVRNERYDNFFYNWSINQPNNINHNTKEIAVSFCCQS